MRRTVFDKDHEDFREMVTSFLSREVVPHFAGWEKEGRIPRRVYQQIADLGILGMSIDEQYGGGGQSSYKYSAVLTETSVGLGVGMGALRVHLDIPTPYLLEYANDEQKSRWLPKVAAGEMMLAIAMTEPGAGSDLAGISTSATRDGDAYVLKGSKTFITGALNSFIVVARTSPATSADRRGGLSLFIVDAGTKGPTVGPNFEKLGLKSQDTAELFFDDVRGPDDCLLGAEGQAFGYLPQERLSIALSSLTPARTAVELTTEHVRERQAFGRSLSSFQNTKFVLASCAIDVAGQAFIDNALEAHHHGELTATDTAKLKLFCAELQGRVVDQCLQLFGGYGYMAGVPHRPHVRRRPRHMHLRRNQRNHKNNHRKVNEPLTRERP